MFKAEDIGKDNRLYFKDDRTTYYSKNKDASNKFVFVTKEGSDQIFKKSISNIIQVDNKKLNEVARMQQLAGILIEIKVNNPTPVQDGDRAKLLVNIYTDGEQAIPEYELEDINEYPLYIIKGDIGIYRDGIFETDDGSDTRIEPQYLRKL